MNEARALLHRFLQPLDRVMMLMVLGVLTLSALVQYSMLGQASAPVADHLLRIFLGLVMLIIAAHVSPQQLHKWTVPAVGCSILLLMLVPLAGAPGGVQRWLDLQVFTLQPSEFLKLTLPMAAASILGVAPLPPSVPRTLAVLALFGGCAAAIALQPDLGTAALLLGIGMVILFLAGIPRKLIFLAVVVAGGSLPFLWTHLLLEYQKDRIRTFLNPESDPLGAGYNIIQSKISIGSGGISGRGWTQGTQSQFDFLPEQSTDFVFAAYAEEFGLIGVGLLFVLYFGILLRLARYFKSTTAPYQRFLIGSLGLSFLMHVLLNIAMTLGYAPVTGSPLPLMSYGGSFLMVTLISLGICMAFYHRSVQRQKIEPAL